MILAVGLKTEYTISDKGLTVKTPMIGYHNSNMYKSYDIPKYVFLQKLLKHTCQN